MSLLRSGENLLDSVKSFIHVSNEVTVYSPFIRVNKLTEILGDVKCNNVIVRWQTGDILSGVCDFEELYYYCSNNGISLYRNPEIHLKAILNEKDQIAFGSSNVTNMGMGETNFNLELSGIQNDISLEDLAYLKRIINMSRLVNDDYFHQLKEKIDKKKEEYVKPPKVEEIEIKDDSKDHFLLSALPMTENPEKLFDICNTEDKSIYSREYLNCAAHDLANYSIQSDLIESEFYSDLKYAFNTHPFIVALKKVIRQEQSIRYGGVVEWIGANTTTVPTPRNWELKEVQIVNILYDWICYFDLDYCWDTPNHSQVIYHRPSPVEKEMLLSELVESLNRNSIDGQKSPHQIILLATLYNLVMNGKQEMIIINDLVESFERIWKDYKGELSSVYMNVGMPIKAFEAQGLLKIQLNDSRDSISDYRNKTDLLMKIRLVKLNKNLEVILKKYPGNLNDILSFL